MFIVDTNVVSTLRKPDKAPHELLAWAEAQDPSQVYISAISIFEIEYGIRLKAHTDAKQGQILLEWFEGIVLPAYDGKILPVCVDTARTCAPLHVPNKRPERDALIAATAIFHQMTLVTRNDKDFLGMNCALLNPWKAA